MGTGCDKNWEGEPLSGHQDARMILRVDRRRLFSKSSRWRLAPRSPTCASCSGFSAFSAHDENPPLIVRVHDENPPLMEDSSGRLEAMTSSGTLRRSGALRSIPCPIQRDHMIFRV